MYAPGSSVTGKATGGSGCTVAGTRTHAPGAPGTSYSTQSTYDSTVTWPPPTVIVTPPVNGPSGRHARVLAGEKVISPGAGVLVGVGVPVGVPVGVGVGVWVGVGVLDGVGVTVPLATSRNLTGSFWLLLRVKLMQLSPNCPCCPPVEPVPWPVPGRGSGSSTTLGWPGLRARGTSQTV